MTTRTRIDIVRDAKAEVSGIGAFNVVLLEHAEAIAEAAEQADLPVVFQISQNCVAYHGSLAPLALATLSIAESLSVPSLVHLDHADDPALVDEAIQLGMHSVMFDASRLPYAENVTSTRDIARRCHERGVLIEAELGEVGGKDGVHAPGARTDPADARRYLEATGVDWLAVAVGTSHAMTTRNASIDAPLVGRIAESVSAPLVLHGSSGLSDDQLRLAVASGMTKVNISTHLNSLFTDSLRGVIADAPSLVDPRRYVGKGRDTITTEIARLLRVLRSAD
ncbi:class II fructose-bisphosphate aldolase [Microbacterium sp. CFBP 13617]|uniref:class II fructose-bisphosphate aldolase n=1 Tax=Microbacterium sp. CFBP 13617 TaxID=2774035 RepID=UPI003140124C